MKFTYDKEVNAAYVYMKEFPIDTPMRELAPIKTEIIYNKNGYLIQIDLRNDEIFGVEIVGPQKK